MKTPKSPPDDPGREIDRQLARMTRRGFAVGGAAVLAGYAGWRWIGSRAEEGRVVWPLRRVLEFDEKVARTAFRPSRQSRSFPTAWARMPRVNGQHGIDTRIDLAAWRLKIQGPSGSQIWTIADVKALPQFEVTTELKCIEGWSEIVTWTGARLSDMAAVTGLARRSGQLGDPQAVPTDLLPYVSLTTPDAGYYVGLDIASALHPQTLLCYAMNGAPLTIPHGAPLRLAIPVKYGIKSLKQIGSITFTESQPADYWATKGYDWYAGF